MQLAANFQEAFSALSQNDAPLAAFYSDGRGFMPLLASRPCARLVSPNPQEIYDFEATYAEHLVVAAFPFEFGQVGLSAPAQLFAFAAWATFPQGQGWVDGVHPEAVEELHRAIKPTSVDDAVVDLGLDSCKIDPEAYQEAIGNILNAIRAGEVYQLNYTTQLKSPTALNPRAAFLPAIRHQPPAFSALVELEQQSLLSLSPERFVQTEGKRIYTDPIKGTSQRNPQDPGDQAQARWLQTNPKEAAELNMITDLLRNDLGQICQVGSVVVEQSRCLSTHPQLLHTHSRVSGRLKPPYRGLRALLPLLPGGSISGCPKSSALKLIRALEPEPRGFYTGSLGYRLPGGDLCFNLLIRTLVFEPHQVSLGVGGGITLESNPTAELNEAIQKAESVLSRFHRL